MSPNYNGLVQILARVTSIATRLIALAVVTGFFWHNKRLKKSIEMLKQALILEPDDWCDTDSMDSDSSDSSFVDSLATSDSDLESLKGKFHQLQTVVNGCT